MIVLAIPQIWAYGYYELLRIVVSVTGLLNIYQIIRYKIKGGPIIMIIITVLFNPIIPVNLSKDTWIFLDFISAICMFVISSEFDKNQ